MSLSLVLRRCAEQDISEATRWYEREQPGREKQFETQLEKAFERIKEHPTRTALYFQDVRFLLLDQFPYVIYYQVQVTRVEVIAVVHTQRSPRVWQRRI